MKVFICSLFISIFSYSLFAQPFVDRAIATATFQTQLMAENMADGLKIPRTIKKDGNIGIISKITDWTVGFYPGSLWLLYDLTKDSKWEVYARAWTSRLEELRHFTGHHDVGFMIGCSYGNGYRLTGDESYKDIIIDAADALCTRFNPTVGCIKSWNFKDPEIFRVIIDNMMNLELLFMAQILTGDKKYGEIAVDHANTTMKNHFRDDFSSYHLVEYSSSTGKVINRKTVQGYADESAWSRGQAWALYGYTMCYRFTSDKKYLSQAEKVAAFILNNENMPEDKVMFWDFDAPKIPDEPRDVSATAIAASALLELSKYSDKNSKVYFDTAETMLKSLTKAPYMADIGENHNFILTNSVGSLPHNGEVSVPLNYADYYFIEALTRYINY